MAGAAVRRVGLVLGGGGLTGTAFHAGVIAGLSDAAGWDARTAELIVGTSAGATSATLLRAGLPPVDFVARMTRAPFTPAGQELLGGVGPLRRPRSVGQRRRRPAAAAMLGELPRSPRRIRPGVLAAALLPEGVLDVADSVAGLGDLFEAWPAEATWICAVRLADGQRVVFGREGAAEVRQAVAASCAIPGYYAPVLIDGHRYVDGGAWSMHNADLLAGSGLDLAIVSAPMARAHAMSASAASDPLPARRSSDGPGSGSGAPASGARAAGGLAFGAPASRVPASRVPESRVPAAGSPLSGAAGWLLRGAIRSGLDRQVRAAERSGTRVLVIAPDRALAEVMGTSTMSLRRRAPVAQATRAYVRRLADEGRLPQL